VPVKAFEALLLPALLAWGEPLPEPLPLPEPVL
jgi:hypothetical protein